MDLKEMQKLQSERNAKMNMGDTCATMEANEQYQNGGLSAGYATNAAQSPRRSPLVDAQIRAKDSLIEAEKATRAATFLSQHPEFDEFIQLVRAGAIQI